MKKALNLKLEKAISEGTALWMLSVERLMLNWIAGFNLNDQAAEGVWISWKCGKWLVQIRKSQSTVLNILEKYEWDLKVE